MSRISIDVTPQEHQRLKAMAALQGKSIKEFVLASTLGKQSDPTLKQGLAELEAALDQRIEEAETKSTSTRSVEEVFQQARQEAGHSPNA